MAGCFDTLQHNTSFDWDTRRNTYSAIFAGFLFFFAWWLVIDTAVVYTPSGNWNNWYFTLAVACSLSMFMVNSVSNRALEGLYSEEGVLGVKGTRIWLMFGFIGSFACIIAGIWIITILLRFGDYVLQKNDNPKWPGVAIFLHTLLTFLASLTYKFGRSEELWD
ncbi:hypothetical protein Mgra_00004119 [Meloidogyne graminicola]|uniref:Transmembrane protein 50A n=1 Tax=Meloidogyne graminicola TaxID=189291 RepID=A0A8S9ZSA7_9BILA|nr:hypothetical protein Mgra_00004119 [Meloidogyne graminicola]